MQHTLLYQNKEIPYTVVKSTRAKNLRITVYSDHNITVTCPQHCTLAAAVAFIERHTIWVARKLEAPAVVKRSTPNLLRKAEYRRHRKAAHTIITERIKMLNVHYNFSYKKISIRNQKTRWGSCSSAGNLSFNYRLLFLPDSLRDYIIVHELCHLKEMNHSSRFWAWVELACPDYRRIRRELRTRGLSLE